MLQVEYTPHTLTLHGQLDEEGTNPLRLGLLHCLESADYDITIDLKDVDFVSYIAMGILVENASQFKAFGGSLKLKNVNQYTERLMRMVGVSNLFGRDSDAATRE